MEKTRLLIVVRGGSIQHISSTNENVEISIIDHDNFLNDNEQSLKEIENVYEPDQIMSKKDMENTINITKYEYTNNTPLPLKEGETADVFIKDEGDFVGVIMQTEKAKKTAKGSGMKNQYDFMPDHFRIDVINSDEIKHWCNKQNLTFETEI